MAQSTRGLEPQIPQAKRQTSSKRSAHAEFTDQDAGKPTQPMNKTSSIHSIKSEDNLKFKPEVNKKSIALADNYRLRKMKNFIDEKNAEEPKGNADGSKTERKKSSTSKRDLLQ